MQNEGGLLLPGDEKSLMGSATRYSLRLPIPTADAVAQNEAYFFLEQNGESRKIRFHEYDEIYKLPGLYEQLFYGRLKCQSPTKMAEWLSDSVREEGEHVQGLRVLDFGAGNGMMGEALAQDGIARLVGIDILQEAKDALDRDRPGLYDDYFVTDLSEPDAGLLHELREWQFNCLTTVAALGFGDIPTQAFAHAYDAIIEGGWICFNIRDSFLAEEDDTGFSVLIRSLLLTKRLELHRMTRYRHRYSIHGEPLYYYGIVGRKRGSLQNVFDKS